MKRYRFIAINETRVDVLWTPQGLRVWINGEEDVRPPSSDVEIGEPIDPPFPEAT